MPAIAALRAPASAGLAVDGMAGPAVSATARLLHIRWFWDSGPHVPQNTLAPFAAYGLPSPSVGAGGGTRTRVRATALAHQASTITSLGDPG